MQLNEKQKKTQEILAKVLVEAWENETFNKELIAQPEEAIEKLTGEKVSLKEGTNMVVVDQTTPNTFYFNIPAKPKLEDMELSEEQMEMVAGGTETPEQKRLREIQEMIALAVKALT